jgi:hypothetical protein
MKSSNQILRGFIFGSDVLAQQFSREPRICRSLTEVFGPTWLARELEVFLDLGNITHLHPRYLGGDQRVAVNVPLLS